jgi:hypothetical protein
MDRYFNNGTGVPMTEDEYYDYTYENDLPDEYDLSQEEKDYLVGKTFDLFYYTSPDSDEETNSCTFWLDEDEEIHFGIGLYTQPLGEDYADLISDKVDPEGKEPFELFCLNFMYNVLCKYGNELSDFSDAAYDFCKAYGYIIRDEKGDDIFEGEIDWALIEMVD